MDDIGGRTPFHQGRWSIGAGRTAGVAAIISGFPSDPDESARCSKYRGRLVNRLPPRLTATASSLAGADGHMPAANLLRWAREL
jgi:hypothetical protein